MMLVTVYIVSSPQSPERLYCPHKLCSSTQKYISFLILVNFVHKIKLFLIFQDVTR